MALNTAQKTSLSITLREFETRLARLRLRLDQSESGLRLTPESVARLRQMIDWQQAIVDELLADFSSSARPLTWCSR
jgi:hypothetical protein